MSANCNHEGSVSWDPFRKAVLCRECGTVFFELEIRADGPVLVPVAGSNMVVRVYTDVTSVGLGEIRAEECPRAEFDLAGDGLVRESALAAFRAVRKSGEPSTAELDTFKKVARAIHERLWRAFTGQVQSDPTPGGSNGVGR